MTETISIDGTARANVIPRASLSLTEKADHGEVGTGSVVLDDDAGSISVVGHKAVTATQDASTDSQTFQGYVGARTYGRGDRQVTGAGREIATDLIDLNARLGLYVIRGRAGNRPKETIGERLTWLLASSFLSGLVVDSGLAQYPTDELDKNDYHSQYPLDVIRDMAVAVGFNYFVYPDPTTGDASLFFDDANTSTAYTSSLRISNDKADIDSSTTFAASQDTTLVRDPAQVYSGIDVPFERGNVFRSRAATAAAYEPRHGVAPNAQIKNRAKAISLADTFLVQRRNEEDLVTTSIRVPAANLNDVRAGHRIEARFTHFATEGYGDWSWFRVLERTVTQPLGTDDQYDLRLTLSPQEAAPCLATADTVPLVQYGTMDGGALVGTVYLPSPATAGNLLVVAMGNRDEISLGPVPAPSTGWNYVPLVGSPYNAQYVMADPLCGGGTGCGHGSIWWKQAAGGETGVTIDAQAGAIIAEFSGFTGTISAIDAAKAESSGNLSASVSLASGAPGVSSIVFANLITRTTSGGSFTPAAGTSQVDGLIQANINGSGSCCLLYGFADDGGSAVTLGGTLSGPYKDGRAAWGMRMAAFQVCPD